MKKIVAAVSILALAAGCNTLAPITTDQGVSNTPPLVEDQTYTNASYNFEFKYSNAFSFVTPTYPNLSQKVVQVQLAKELYPQTNFDDGAFSVATSYAKTSTECLEVSLPENAKAFTETKTLNGVKFFYTTGSGAGAGNFYESRIYRTLDNNTCYELNETLHTSNIANYPEGTVTEVSKAPIWQKLDNIVTSFKFKNN